jgi:hypothetical protein
MDRYDDSYDDDGYFDGDGIFVEPPADDDAVEHLWNAAHELLRAFRTIVDAADEFVETQRGAMSRRVPREPAPERESRVRRIDIDDRGVADDPGDRSSGSSDAPGATPR